MGTRTARRSVWREYLEALLVAAAFLQFANTFVLKTFFIPSSSMEKTLLVGDHLVVNRAIYGPSATAFERALLPQRAVRRGDIVVFRSPESPRVDLVKRCIALPGDSVEMLKKQLYINGERADEHLFVQHVDPRVVAERTPYNARDFRRDNFGPFTVPEGHYFCLGDNRDRSKDSRYWGPVPAHYLKGRAVAIYWSFGGETWDGQTHDFGTRLSQLAGTVLGFFTKTRWERSFQTVR